MAKHYKMTLTQTIFVEFEAEGATETSAKYVAENIGCCHIREGWSKNIATKGKFIVYGEDAKATDIREIVDTVPIRR